MTPYRNIDKHALEAIVIGGSILAGGGGGLIEDGLRLGLSALEMGDVNLVSINDLDEDEILKPLQRTGPKAYGSSWGPIEAVPHEGRSKGP